jgi:hypothetical protein
MDTPAPGARSDPCPDVEGSATSTGARGSVAAPDGAGDPGDDGIGGPGVAGGDVT